VASSLTTRPSLLARVRNAADAEGWRQFEAAYGDLILRYCRRRGLQLADAEDVRQVVLTKLARSLRHFEYDRARGRFRDYLGRCVRNAISSERARHTPEVLTVSLREDTDVPRPAPQGADDPWNEEWVQHHYRRAMRTLRATCDEQTLAVFEAILQGRDYAAIAGEFNATEAAVRKTKQRMRERLQQLIHRQVCDEDIPPKP
jgi:RNA polymerase sigma-70 factor (ECF subfamily)